MTSYPRKNGKGSPLDLTGFKFGKLTAIKEDHIKKNYRHYWLCKCECGNKCVVYVSNLTTGKTKSCGCINKYNAEHGVCHKVHGLRKTRLYTIWANMKTRCYNTNDPHYKRWGAKGVVMCEEWKNDFKAFYDWSMSNGYTDELTIDRIDSTGNYEPNNCRWVTLAENNRNKLHVRYITYNGKTQTIGQWSKELGLGKETIRQRLKRGWTETEALIGR